MNRPIPYERQVSAIGSRVDHGTMTYSNINPLVVRKTLTDKRDSLSLSYQMLNADMPALRFSYTIRRVLRFGIDSVSPL
jgi:hypothetical protein